MNSNPCICILFCDASLNLKANQHPIHLPAYAMAKGRVIQCPLGAPMAKKRAKKAPQGSAQAVAELEASESIWAKKHTDELERALANIPAVYNQRQDNHDGFAADFEQDFENLPDDYINNFLPQNNNGEVPPDPHGSFGEYIRGSYYKTKQLKDGSNWKRVLGEMFIAYMTCSQRTSQWGDTATWNLDRNKKCSCGDGDRHTRDVDMVDILGQSISLKFIGKSIQALPLIASDVESTERRQTKISFCKCTLDQVSLIRMGFIGGSPIAPRTAYSIRLLRLHHTIWKYCCVRTQGFSLALDEFLDAHSPLILVEGTNEVRPKDSKH